MASPVPTTLLNHDDRSAGPAHCGGRSRDCRVRRRGGDDLADALMIEYHGHAIDSNENRHPTPDNQRFGMVYPDSVSTDPFDKIWMKRRPPLKRANRGLKVLNRHKRHHTMAPRDRHLSRIGRRSLAGDAILLKNV